MLGEYIYLNRLTKKFDIHTSKSIFVKFCTNISNKLLLYISCASWATTISDRGSESAVPYNKFFITRRFLLTSSCA